MFAQKSMPLCASEICLERDQATSFLKGQFMQKKKKKVCYPHHGRNKFVQTVNDIDWTEFVFLPNWD